MPDTEGCQSISRPARACLIRSPEGLGSTVGELNDNLDVIRGTCQGALEMVGLLAACDQAIEPRALRACQSDASLVPVPLVGVDTAEHGFVVEHHASSKFGSVGSYQSASATHTSETDDAARSNQLDR